VLPLAVVVFLVLCVAPAFGALTHPLKATLGPFPEPAGIAIDASNGNVFIFNGLSSNTIEIVGPEGGPPSGVAVTKIEGFDYTERADLAIDNSPASPSKGALYVVDRGNKVVKKFTLNPTSEEYELKDTLTGNPPFSGDVTGNVTGVAVDAKGNVFVSEKPDPTADGYIVEFSPTGEEIDRVRFSEASASLNELTRNLAFDSAGNLYAEAFAGTGIWKFAANGSGDVDLSTVPTQLIRQPFIFKAGLSNSGGPTGIDVNQGDDTLYLAAGKRIAQYSTSCVPVPTPGGENCVPEREFGLGLLSSTERVAVSPINGDIYVADSAKGKVVVFDAGLATIPDPLTEAATVVKQTSATLSGTVSADGGPPASCEFQYTTKADFEAKEFEGASVAPCSPGGPFTGSAKEAVKAEVSGLDAGTAYVFRLQAENENGLNFGEALSFSTVGKPKINASFISLVTLNSATVEGLVNPNGGPGAVVGTTYTVEYVSAKEFEENEYDNATKVPAGGKGIGSGTKDVEVAQNLSGLSAGGAYHFRIVAENEAGKEIGPDKIFTTYNPAPSGLPDGRVYEQVTPVDKNGGSPSGGLGAVQAAFDGEGITYVSGGGIPGAEGSQQYPNYLASRGSDWSTQGLLPPASSGPSAAVLGWSEDLSQVFDVQASLPGTPARFLARDSASHALRTIASEGGKSIAAPAFAYAGASSEGSVVAFESDTPLSPGGAENSYNTYAWDRESGELILVGVLPDGTVPKKGSNAGGNTSDIGGAGHYYYTQDQHTVSSDGSRIFFSDPNTGQLYVRVNPTAEEGCAVEGAACTVNISASQRTTPPLKDKKLATFQGATPDGSRAFFTTPGKLTDDATTGPKGEGNDLYRYDTESGELIDIAPDAGDPNGAEVQGVLGISDDGSYVYFAANGKLDSAPSPGSCGAGSGVCNLYLWHEGDGVVFIAQLSAVLTAPKKDEDNWVSRPVGDDKTARVSADGQTLLFRSQRQLSAYDNQGTPELYRYQAGDPQPECISCNPTGAAPVGFPALRSINKAPLQASPSPASILTRNLSADGNRVFFETPDKLVASDVNGDGGCELATTGARFCQDVYEWEAKGTGSCASEADNGGCLYLLSSGTSSEPSYFGDADEEGDNAFLFTDSSLVKQDSDGVVDIYDARVGGGIASQNHPPDPEPCPGLEACRGGVPQAPVPQSPGSSSFSGPGNPQPCKKGKVRKRGRCVKKSRRPHKRKQHKARHASGKRG
jgi:sugar lactone lactonase YvrE